MDGWFLRHIFLLSYSATTVSPSDEETLLKVVYVVEPVGTYTVLVVPLFDVTKLVALDTFVEPMCVENPFRALQLQKQ